MWGARRGREFDSSWWIALSLRLRCLLQFFSGLIAWAGRKRGGIPGEEKIFLSSISYVFFGVIFSIDSRITFIIWFLPVSDPEGRHHGVGGGVGGLFTRTLIWRCVGILLGIFIRCLMAGSFDHWQKDVFFSAAEEVQESADAYALISLSLSPIFPGFEISSSSIGFHVD